MATNQRNELALMAEAGGLSLLKWVLLDMACELPPFQRVAQLLSRELHHEGGWYCSIELGDIPPATVREAFEELCVSGWIEEIGKDITDAIVEEQRYVFGTPRCSRADLLGMSILTVEGLSRWLSVRIPGYGCGPPRIDRGFGIEVFRRPKAFKLQQMPSGYLANMSLTDRNPKCGIIEPIGPWCVPWQVAFPCGWRLILPENVDHVPDWATNHAASNRWYCD